MRQVMAVVLKIAVARELSEAAQLVAGSVYLRKGGSKGSWRGGVARPEYINAHRPSADLQKHEGGLVA